MITFSLHDVNVPRRAKSYYIAVASAWDCYLVLSSLPLDYSDHIKMSFFSHVEIRTSFTDRTPFRPVYSYSEPLGDRCHDYGVVSPAPRQCWSVEQRLTLWLLRERYDLAWADIKSIFDALFKHELASTKGPSTAALRAMHYRLLQENYNFSGSWISLRQAIKSKAKALDICLNNEDFFTEDIRKLTSESILESQVDSGNESDSTLLGDDYDFGNTPSKHSKNPPQTRRLKIPSLQTPLIREKQIRRFREKEVPMLGFRTLYVTPSIRFWLLLGLCLIFRSKFYLYRVL